MKMEDLRVVKKRAKRLLKLIKLAEKTNKDPLYLCAYSSSADPATAGAGLSGAVRRASMDLTRSLSVMRRGYGVHL